MRILETILLYLKGRNMGSSPLIRIMETEDIEKEITLLERELDEAESRGYGFSAMQIEDQIEDLKKLLK